MERATPLVLVALALAAATACGGETPTRPSGSPAASVETDARSGGDMTVYDASSRAFSRPGPALSAFEMEAHRAGDAVFEATFVPAPAPVNPGLGPRFDNVSCSGCHAGDGRGRPPGGGELFESMLFRVSVDGTGPHGGPAPVPDFGTQMELQAIVGLDPMASVRIEYADSAGTYADGTPFQLRVPTYVIEGPYRPLPGGVLVSPRVAPPNFGLGLLEAVPEATLSALARDPDALAHGVSGRLNHAWSPVDGRSEVGRFGLKANAATLEDQVVTALNQDIGITTSVLPDEPCADSIPACGGHPPDLPDSLVRVLTDYVQTLGVPARRDVRHPRVLRGQELFGEAGCADCHVPTLETGDAPDHPALAHQRIPPYTDLLLHDMGPGLADGRPDFAASGREWRTPPLWGIGLTEVVNGHATFLHDGRARSLAEAILWHGGESAFDQVREVV